MRTYVIAIVIVIFCRLGFAQQSMETDLLIVGGDESGCAAAVQAARLGVKRILLVNDIEWLGGQFCTQGIGPVDEWTIVDGKRVNFPRSGAFSEIIDRVRAHNLATYGIARPGNSWCGTETIEPIAAAKIFEDWLSPYSDKGTGQITIQRGWRPTKVITQNGRVHQTVFERATSSIPPKSASANTASIERLEVGARLTIDSSDWGDVIRLSGAGYMAGPDLRSRFQEPSAPEVLDDGAHQEMNPISWCPMVRESGAVSTISQPKRYDPAAFSDWNKAPPWVEWDGSGGIYNFSGWSIYTHRRMVDRYHNDLRAGVEATILNWPAHDYPLSTLPKHVVDALEETEKGASRKNIVEMSYDQRQIVYEDAKQRALEFLYWLQTAAHDRVGDYPQSFRYMKLADDYGSTDCLPPKPYIREGLRLQALYVTRETDVRTEVESPMWAQSMVPDGVFGWQFNMDFHPTRRIFVGDGNSTAWRSKHYRTRNWNAYTNRSMFPLRGLVPAKLNGLIGASKNIGVSSMVQSALRLHGQMMHVGTASGTLAAMALREGVEPRQIAASPRKVRSLQQKLVRGASGPGVLLWPWHDLKPDDLHFEAANLLTVSGIWRPDKTSLYFQANRPVTRRELASSLVRLCRSVVNPKEWPKFSDSCRFSDVPFDDPDRAFIETLSHWTSYDPARKTFEPDEVATWGSLNEWLASLELPVFPSLVKKGSHGDYGKNVLTRSECVDYLYRVLQLCKEAFPPDDVWLLPGGDDDGDGKDDLNDALPFDRDNNSVPDRLQPPNLAHSVVPFGRRVLVSDYGGNKVAIIAEDGRIEWSVPAEKPQDSGFQRPPNGHTVVVNWLGHGYLATTGQFFELDKNKLIVRQFTDHSQFTSINKVQLLDVAGDPAENDVLR